MSSAHRNPAHRNLVALQAFTIFFAVCAYPEIHIQSIATLLQKFSFPDEFKAVSLVSHDLNAVLPEFRRVARKLIVDGYYSGFLEAIKDSMRVPEAVIVLDCPSGSGKTLAGIALRELDCTRANNLAHCFDKRVKLKVVHVVWEKAVDSQNVYRAIVTEQESERIFGQAVFSCARRFITRSDLDVHAKFAEILKSVFPESGSSDLDLAAYVRKLGLEKKRLIFFIDEIPTSCDDIQFVGTIRDFLKKIPDVTVILSGTHSKAANMLGLQQGAASSRELRPCQPWALLITRLPGFALDASGLSRSWRSIRRAANLAPEDDTAQSVIAAIQSAIDRFANPRLLYHAIADVEDLLQMNGISPSFYRWQTKFSESVNVIKFRVESRWSEAFNGIIGQLNLLLEGSATSSLADAMIGEHFAQRAVPNFETGCGVRANSGMGESCGWLYISSSWYKALGHSLFYIPGPYVLNANEMHPRASLMWQTTTFPTVERDPLIYLGSCRRDGFFSVCDAGSTRISYDACKVVLHLWSSNSVGAINYQNPRARVNTGSFMEAMLAAAAFNAATRFVSYCGSLDHYLLGIIRELGISSSDIDLRYVQNIFSEDQAFSGVLVPRCLFPGDRLPAKFPGTIGLIQRAANKDQCDLLVRRLRRKVDGAEVSVCMEAKDSSELTNAEMATIASKLVQKEGDVGLVIVRTCCGYWKDDRAVEYNRRQLLAEMENNKLVGKIYFVNDSGELSVLEVSDQRGRMVVIKVPESSLRFD